MSDPWFLASNGGLGAGIRSVEGLGCSAPYRGHSRTPTRRSIGYQGRLARLAHRQSRRFDSVSLCRSWRLKTGAAASAAWRRELIAFTIFAHGVSPLPSLHVIQLLTVSRKPAAGTHMPLFIGNFGRIVDIAQRFSPRAAWAGQYSSVFLTYSRYPPASTGHSLFQMPVNQHHRHQMNSSPSGKDRRIQPSRPMTAGQSLTDIEPVVIGPGGQLYLTDGHHTFTALSRFGLSAGTTIARQQQHRYPRNHGPVLDPWRRTICCFR